MNTVMVNAVAMARRLRRRRIVAAVLAAGLSLAGHVLLALYFPWGSLSAAGLRMPERSVDHRAFDVEIQPAEWVRTVATMEALRWASRDPRAQAPEPVEPPDAVIDAAVFEPLRSPEQLVDREMLVDTAVLQVGSPVDIGPGQEIMQITERVVAEPEAALQRLLKTAMERQPSAPDIVMPSDTEEFRSRASAPGMQSFEQNGLAPHSDPASGLPAVDRGAGLVRVGEMSAAGAEHADRMLSELAGDTEEVVTPVTAVDRHLKLRARQHVSVRDRKNVYLELLIERHDTEVGQEAFLDVLPKDVFFIKDLSGSMGERRVDAGREGIRRGLRILSENDRFNIVTFAHQPDQLSDRWIPATAAGLQQAEPFLAAMVSEGMTDIDAALNRVLELERDPGRPTLALMITDGIPTAGVTNSTRIIEEFSTANRGAISVFAVAAADESIANMYLLDMLSYRNRGDARMIEGFRAEIPELIENLCHELSRPVLTDLRCRFTDDRESEVYPAVLPHLYLDRPLVLYGRVPRENRNPAFQVIGLSGDQFCDFIFELRLDEIPVGDENIRRQWARHRVYALIGEHMRTGDSRLLRRLFETANAYGIEVPYLDDFAAPSRFRFW